MINEPRSVNKKAFEVEDHNTFLSTHGFSVKFLHVAYGLSTQLRSSNLLSVKFLLVIVNTITYLN